MQNIVRVTAADCETQLERLLQYIYIYNDYMDVNRYIELNHA